MRRLPLALALFLVPLRPGGAQAPPGGGTAQEQPPRWQLAGAFVRRDSAVVRRLLAPDVMIWPPSPDTARRGSAAIAYVQRLAVSSHVSRSELRPRSVKPDGASLLEDGVWTLTHGRTRFSARYDLRWRRVGGRWRVSFLRWELFR
ncbi:MAG TPA: DUF4440 domain-containing protein [Gemmatimonadales bacterium]|jgi:hypothetical protein|nr:DUF4440 domain-containing protein [Gemmatimonadales bacterium]